MPGHQVLIGCGATQWTFPSKQDAMTACKTMLARYRNRQTINDDDSEFLRALIQRHPEACQKIGAGIKRFFRAGTGQGTDCFWLERVDGSTTDFSYKSCINARGKSIYQEFSEACWQAVREDLDRAKKEHFSKHADAEGKVPCDITGERIGWKEAHLDHKKPMTFQVIVLTFIQADSIDIRPELLSSPGDKQFVTTFADKNVEMRFRAYHHGLAKLRIIKKGLNLSLGGSERMTSPKRPVSLDFDV
jgi:hypothetical protein